MPSKSEVVSVRPFCNRPGRNKGDRRQCRITIGIERKLIGKGWFQALLDRPRVCPLVLGRPRSVSTADELLQGLIDINCCLLNRMI